MTEQRHREKALTGTGEPHNPQQPRIADRCPSCGARSLFIGSGGWLTCSVIGCKNPAHGDALAALLADCEAPLREQVAKTERERDGYRNGQLQVQATLVGVMDTNTKLCAERDALALRVGVLRVVAAEVWAELDEKLRGGTGLNNGPLMETMAARLRKALATPDAAAEAMVERIRAEERERCLAIVNDDAMCSPQDISAAIRALSPGTAEVEP